MKETKERKEKEMKTKKGTHPRTSKPEEITRLQMLNGISVSWKERKGKWKRKNNPERVCLEIRKKGKRNQNYISAINVQETASRG